jgi:hypothetical protein
VERAHRQLRAGFADRLRGDDADRFADIDRRTAREVAAVAFAADAVVGLRRSEPNGSSLRHAAGVSICSAPTSSISWPP